MASTALTTRSSALSRAWAQTRAFVARTIGVGLEVAGFGGGGVPVASDYEPERVAQAIRNNAWVYVCIQAIATDLASLPIVAVEGEGPDERLIKNHWLPQLLKKPHPKVTGRKLRKQAAADLRSQGNAYYRLWRNRPGERPYAISRIPPDPSFIQPIVVDDGEEVGWIVGPSKQRLAWEDVLHMADLSFTFDAQLVLGISPLEPLRMDLAVDRDNRKQAGRSARRGRLEVIASPSDSAVQFSAEKARAVADNYRQSVHDGDGIFVVNQGIKVDQVAYTPKDGDFAEFSRAVKSAVLAAFQVPPIRVGDPAANYGTAKQQMRTYWEGLVGWAAIIDDELSRLCEPGVSVRHDFSGVEALQSSYTERQARALSWTRDFGMDRKVAAQYEGFLAAPVPPGKFEPVAAAPKADGPAAHGNPPADQPREQKAFADAIFRVLQHAEGAWTEDSAESLSVELCAICLHYRGTTALNIVQSACDMIEATMAAEADDEYKSAMFSYAHAERIARSVP